METEKLKISIEIEAPKGFFVKTREESGVGAALMDLGRTVLGNLGCMPEETKSNVSLPDLSKLTDAPGKVPLTELGKRVYDVLGASHDENAETKQAQEEVKPKRTRKGVAEAPVEQATEQAIPTEEPMTLSKIRALSATKDDKNANGSRGKIRAKLAELDATSLSELKPENFTEFAEFLNSLPDAK